jgi:hypothetical protein
MQYKIWVRHECDREEPHTFSVNAEAPSAAEAMEQAKGTLVQAYLTSHAEGVADRPAHFRWWSDGDEHLAEQMIVTAVKNGDRYQEMVFLVVFPLLGSGEKYGVIIERSDWSDYTEDHVKRLVIAEIQVADEEEAGDYPEDLDMDENHVTCHRMTLHDAAEAAKDTINTSWWG